MLYSLQRKKDTAPVKAMSSLLFFICQKAPGAVADRGTIRKYWRRHNRRQYESPLTQTSIHCHFAVHRTARQWGYVLSVAL